MWAPASPEVKAPRESQAVDSLSYHSPYLHLPAPAYPPSIPLPSPFVSGPWLHSNPAVQTPLPAPKMYIKTRAIPRHFFLSSLYNIQSFQAYNSLKRTFPYPLSYVSYAKRSLCITVNHSLHRDSVIFSYYSHQKSIFFASKKHHLEIFKYSSLIPS